MASHVDVLIIGGGPSGLMAALWLARCGIYARIIDQNRTKVFRGHADGLHIRTLEIFDSFGIADEIVRIGAPMIECANWAVREDGELKRVFRATEWLPELGRFHLTAVNQGITERELLKGIESFGGLPVERGVIATDIAVDESAIGDPQSHAVSVTVRHLKDEEFVDSEFRTIPSPGNHDYAVGEEKHRIWRPSGKEGTTEVIQAKYVLGCDGTSSLVRQKLGFSFTGPPREAIGGVIDCVPDTDFPDIYTRTVLSKDKHPLMIIPRENGMIRIGTQFDTLEANEITADLVLSSIKEMLHPYKFEIKRLDWFGRFQGSQRMSSAFSKRQRVFLAGDALHTHSPKAGIGMNFSLQDRWKLVHVLRGIANPEILKTYELERGYTTRALIEYDKGLSKSFANNNFSVEVFSAKLTEALPFVTCTGIEYPPGPLVAGVGCEVISKQHLASRAIVGRRLRTSKVFTHARMLPTDLEKYFLSDGRYRILIFAGNLADPSQFARVQRLSDTLQQPNSFVQKVARGNTKPGDVFDVSIVHTAPRNDFHITQLPHFLISSTFPSKLEYRSFVDNPELWDLGPSDAYTQYGIGTGGCLMLLRPDRHIMYIGELEDAGDIERLVSSILVCS